MDMQNPRPPRALIYDDDEAFAEECAEALIRHGYDARTRAGRSKFEPLLSAIAPDLLILDLHMPGLDGFEALRVIQGYERKGDLTVIIVSAADSSLISSARALSEAYEIRLSGILRKPIKPGELESLLTQTR